MDPTVLVTDHSAVFWAPYDFYIDGECKIGNSSWTVQETGDAQRFTSCGVSFLSHVQDSCIQYQEGLIDKGIREAESALMAASFSQPGLQNMTLVGERVRASYSDPIP